jgi:hypothetical protein
MRKIRTLFLAFLLSGSVLPAAHASPPAAPSKVTVTSVSLANAALNQAQVEVSWESAVSGALGYVITATATGEDIVSKTITPGTLTSTILEGLSGGASYKFKVAAKNVDGETAAPDVTFVPRSIPAAPTASAPVVAKGQATLSWTAPTNSGGVELTGYSITATGVPTVTARPESTTVIITGLSNGVEYEFTIKATNIIGSSLGATVKAKIPNRPEIPTQLAATVSSSTISTTWVAPLDNGGSAITSYTAYLYDSTGSEITAQRKSVTSAAADFTGLAGGTTYTVKVSATNIVGESDKTAATSPQRIEAASALSANDPVISPGNISDLPIDSTFVLTATAPSGGAVTLAVSPSSVCRIETATGVVTGISAGTCSIAASIAQAGNFQAGLTPKNFNVVKVTQTINFPTISPQTMPGPVGISATSSSGTPVVFTASGNCTVSGTTVSLTAAGSCTITANASTTTKFLAASPVSKTFTISAAQTPPSGGTTSFPAPIIIPAPLPSLTPSPSPTPSPSASATPSSTPSPSPTASAAPTPSASAAPSPTASPKPSASPAVSVKPSLSPSGLTLKPNTYVAIATSKTPTTRLSLTTTSKSLAVTAGKAIAVSLPSVAKGTTVVTSLKMPDGKTVQVSSIKTTKTGQFTVPSLLLKKAGTYTLQIKIGKTTKSVKVTVKK